MKLSWLCSLIVVLVACCCRASATDASLILVNASYGPKSGAAHRPGSGSRWSQDPRGRAVTQRSENAGPDTRIIDLGGRLLLPGFNDSHVHFLIGGGSLITVHLGEANSQAEFKERIAQSPEPCPKVRGFAMAFGSSTLESGRSAQPPVD